MPKTIKMKESGTQYLLFIIIAIAIVFNSCSTMTSNQNDAEVNFDMLLTNEFTSMVNAGFDKRDSLSELFKVNLKEILIKPQTFYIPFDSLATQIKIVASSDSLLRIFSYDERTGGSWHDNASIAQFRVNNDQIIVQQLDTDEEYRVGGYTDVIIYKIHTLEIDDNTYYLTIGWGTHGSGLHHELVQIFTYDGKVFRKADFLFENEESLLVVAPRRDKISIVYDSIKKEIDYTYFVGDEETGRYNSTGFHKILKLEGRNFKSSGHYRESQNKN